MWRIQDLAEKWHPASNGACGGDYLAEAKGDDLQVQIARILLAYRLQPC